MPYDRTAYITTNPLESTCFDYMVEDSGLIAEKVFPAKPVPNSVFKAYQADTSKLRPIETRASTNAVAPLIDEQLFSTSVTLEEHKVGKEVNPRNVRDADQPYMLGEVRAAKLATHALMLKREILAATLATTAANYPTALKATLADGSRWNQSNGDPENDKITADAALLNACGRKANALAMDWLTYSKLRTSPILRSRTQYTNGGPIPDETLKAYFDVQFLNVSTIRYDTAVEGAAASMTNPWSTYVLAYVYNPSPGMEDMSYGHMYLANQPFWTKVREDESRSGPAGSMKVVEVGTEYKFAAGYVVSSSDSDFNAGYLWTTAVS